MDCVLPFNQTGTVTYGTIWERGIRAGGGEAKTSSIPPITEHMYDIKQMEACLVERVFQFQHHGQWMAREWNETVPYLQKKSSATAF